MASPRIRRRRRKCCACQGAIWFGLVAPQCSVMATRGVPYLSLATASLKCCPPRLLSLSLSLPSAQQQDVSNGYTTVTKRSSRRSRFFFNTDKNHNFEKDQDRRSVVIRLQGYNVCIETGCSVPACVSVGNGSTVQVFGGNDQLDVINRAAGTVVVVVEEDKCVEGLV